MLDDWADPRLLDLDAPGARVLHLSDSDASLVALVDPVDWEWARRYRWGFRVSNPRLSGHEKVYAVRTVWQPQGPCFTSYLHKEVVLRALGPAPTPAHTIGDHRNGDSLDCRRDNLSWATPSMNRHNRVD